MKTIFIITLFYTAICGFSFRPFGPVSVNSHITVDSTSKIALDCQKIEEVQLIISDAIAIGAPSYNDGYHAACYRIYEGAAYKILYEHGSKCKHVSKNLKTALQKSYGSYTYTEKAWIMRIAFDEILGVETKTK